MIYLFVCLFNPHTALLRRLCGVISSTELLSLRDCIGKHFNVIGAYRELPKNC